MTFNEYQAMRAEVERQMFYMARNLQTRRYPPWLLNLDNDLAPENQVFRYAALVAAKIAGDSFRQYAQLSDATIFAGEDKSNGASKASPRYLTPAEATRIDRAWNLREEGARLLRLGLKRRREIIAMTHTTIRAQADQDYRLVHRENLENVNTNLLKIGEMNLYFADSQDPEYEGYCAFQRWRIPNTLQNRRRVEQYLPNSLDKSEHRFRCGVIRRCYSVEFANT